MLKYTLLFSVDKFFMCKNDILYFYKMFIVFYTKNCVYLCIYDLFHILLSL